MSVSTKGITPLKMVVKLTSCTTPWITKTFMPTGGWIRPRAPTVITMITPNQIGSSRADHREDDGHGQDDHRHRIHQAAEQQATSHDQRQHAVAADAQAGEEFGELRGVCVMVRK